MSVGCKDGLCQRVANVASEFSAHLSAKVLETSCFSSDSTEM